MVDAKSILNAILGAGGQSGAGNALGSLLDRAKPVAGRAEEAAGGLAGMIGSVLSQAGQGLQQGGRDVNRATGGLGDELGKMAGQLSGGRSPADLLAQAKELIGKNPELAAAAAAGLGGVILGTKGGRGLAAGAAKLGGLALIGGLAYSALTNYRNGRPLLNQPGQIDLAPQGSGFAEGDGDDDARALLMVRAMVAAAASDGQIDASERARIKVNLEQAGLADEASRFIDEEFARPLSLAALIEMSASPEMAAQMYTAARLVIVPDSQAEMNFLADLAAGLGLESELVSHIDAAASAVTDVRGV